VKAGTKFAGRRNGQHGFTLVEMLIATLIVIVGLVAVAQLVPVSVLMKSNNRNDGTALVFAQREMEALREQPLTSLTFSDPVGVACPIATTCNLGNPTQPGQLVGSPVVVNSNSGALMIDFSAGKVSGYSFTYTDPNDPYNSPYDVRWGVITVTNGQLVTGKRIIVGVFRPGMQTLSLPITLDTMVEK
jgi:prepilin-type N-terminal cleavage/methylation domain-containing protein